MQLLQQLQVTSLSKDESTENEIITRLMFGSFHTCYMSCKLDNFPLLSSHARRICCIRPNRHTTLSRRYTEFSDGFAKTPKKTNEKFGYNYWCREGELSTAFNSSVELTTAGRNAHSNDRVVCSSFFLQNGLQSSDSTAAKWRFRGNRH